MTCDQSTEETEVSSTVSTTQERHTIGKFEYGIVEDTRKSTLASRFWSHSHYLTCRTSRGLYAPRAKAKDGFFPYILIEHRNYRGTALYILGATSDPSGSNPCRRPRWLVRVHVHTEGPRHCNQYSWISRSNEAACTASISARNRP